MVWSAPNPSILAKGCGTGGGRKVLQSRGSGGLLEVVDLSIDHGNQMEMG